MCRSGAHDAVVAIDGAGFLHSTPLGLTNVLSYTLRGLWASSEARRSRLLGAARDACVWLYLGAGG